MCVLLLLLFFSIFNSCVLFHRKYRHCFSQSLMGVEAPLTLNTQEPMWQHINGPQTWSHMQPEPTITFFPLTNVNHIYVHWVWEGAAKRISGHNGDVVVDPDGRVILVEEAGVLPSCMVVWAFVYSIWAAEGKGRIFGYAKSQRRKNNSLLPTKKQPGSKTWTIYFMVYCDSNSYLVFSELYKN